MIGYSFRNLEPNVIDEIFHRRIGWMKLPHVVSQTLYLFKVKGAIIALKASLKCDQNMLLWTGIKSKKVWKMIYSTNKTQVIIQEIFVVELLEANVALEVHWWLPFFNFWSRNMQWRKLGLQNVRSLVNFTKMKLSKWFTLKCIFMMWSSRALCLSATVNDSLGEKSQIKQP